MNWKGTAEAKSTAPNSFVVNQNRKFHLHQKHIYIFYSNPSTNTNRSQTHLVLVKWYSLCDLKLDSNHEITSVHDQHWSMTTRLSHANLQTRTFVYKEYILENGEICFELKVVSIVMGHWYGVYIYCCLAQMNQTLSTCFRHTNIKTLCISCNICWFIRVRLFVCSHGAHGNFMRVAGKKLDF